MFIVGLITVGKLWKQPMFVNTLNELRKYGIYGQWNAVQILNEVNPAICNNMGNLKDIILNEISQTQKDKYHMIIYMQNCF